MSSHSARSLVASSSVNEPETACYQGRIGACYHVLYLMDDHSGPVGVNRTPPESGKNGCGRALTGARLEQLEREK